MDLETVSASDFGQSLKGVGVNLLTPDVRKLAGFLIGVFGAAAHRVSDDFAIVVMGGDTGVQFYLFDVDPDAAIEKAETFGGTVLESAADKPHGLYECTILSPEGHAFSPAVPSMEA